MDQITLNAEARTDVGSPASRRLRHAGRTPCVVYDAGKAEHLTVDAAELVNLVESHTHVFDVVGPDGGGRVQLKEVQWDTFGDYILHADFARIKAGATIEVNVAIRFSGTAAGVDEGGVLDTPIDSLRVAARASNLPDEIEVDVSPLGLGDILRVSDLVAIEGAEFLDDPNTVVANVVAPMAEEDDGEDEGEGESPAEPTVLTEREESDD